MHSTSSIQFKEGSFIERCCSVTLDASDRLRIRYPKHGVPNQSFQQPIVCATVNTVSLEGLKARDGEHICRPPMTHDHDPFSIGC